MNIQHSHFTKQTEHTKPSLGSIWHNISFCSFDIHLKYHAQTKWLDIFRKIDCIIHEKFAKVIQSVPINSVALPKIAEKFCKLPKLLRQIRQPADGYYWLVSGVLRTSTAMHCKHTHSQGININKVDECVTGNHWKAFITKHYRTAVFLSYTYPIFIDWIFQQLC